MSAFIDLTGQRFGRLVVLQKAKTRVTPGGQKIAYVRCHCDCGNEIELQARNLRDGITRSCGCLRREEARRNHLKHGESRSALYAVHREMKQRCMNPKNPSYKWYGARGITVCPAWQTYPPFRDWAMSHGYRSGLTIERIDNSHGYSPENCTWITIQEQQKNRRPQTRNNKEATI